MFRFGLSLRCSRLPRRLRYHDQRADFYPSSTSCGSPSAAFGGGSPRFVTYKHTGESYSELPNSLNHGAIIRYPHRGRAHILEAGEARSGEALTISVIGASGTVGRQIASAVVAKRKNFAGLGPMNVQFVGQREDHSLATLIGLCSELRDAYEDYCPHLEVAVDVEAVRADIIIMAAGAALSKQFPTRVDLARSNASIFRRHASALIDNNRHALVLVVSSPDEFGVDTFVQAGFSPTQVMGCGAYLDSLRFRREISSELGVARQHISGLVLGAHGLAMVPCWSTVRIAPMISSAETNERLEAMKSEGLSRMPYDLDFIRTLAYEVRDLAIADKPLAAAALVNKQPADIRAIVRRYLSFFSGPFYPRFGVAESVADLISKILSGNETIAAGQIRILSGDFLGHSEHAIGAPCSISSRGFEYAPLKLAPPEQEALKISFEDINMVHSTSEAKVLWSILKQKAALAKKNGGAVHAKER